MFVTIPIIANLNCKEKRKRRLKLWLILVAPGDITPSTTSTEEQQNTTATIIQGGSSSSRSGNATPGASRAHQFVTNPPLTIEQLQHDPLHQFNSWFHDARLPPSSAPETCTLATASLPSGRVSARVLYLKELDEKGWVIYSNWGSKDGKGAQVFGESPEKSQDDDGLIPAMPLPGQEEEAKGGNRWGALTFFWPRVERQVRVEGLLEPVSREESETYWRTRERGSRIGGWASWQSRILWDSDNNDNSENDDDGRAALEQRVKEMEERFTNVDDIPLPPFWGGVRLVPESVEFWQGRKSRLHDRFRYVRVHHAKDQWRIERLSP